jgi:integrase
MADSAEETPRKKQISLVNKTDGDLEIVRLGAELPLQPALVAATRAYRASARAPRTRDAYRAAWQRFAAWCAREGRTPLPASPETVAAWMTALADGLDGPPRAAATINAYFSGVINAHRAAGHAFDRKHTLVAETWSGISRTKAKTHTKRQAKPLMAADLHALLRDFHPALVADARDAALLALGWAGALRRSELVGLDWQQRGDGTGTVSVEEGRGLVIRLATSKGSQTEATEVVIPSADMPTACEAVAHWARSAKLNPNDPLFCPVDKGQRLRPGRLTGRSVSRIVKTRLRALAKVQGWSATEVETMVAQFSGHSLRAGYATEAGAKDLPSYRIMQHTRHKSHEMVASYIRAGQRWTKSGLKGVGF